MAKKPRGLLEEIQALLDDVHSDDPTADAVWDLHGTGGSVRQVLEAEHKRLTVDLQSNGAPYLHDDPDRLAILEFIVGAKAKRMYDLLAQVVLAKLQSPIEEKLVFGLILAAWKESAGIDFAIGKNQGFKVRVGLCESSGHFYEVESQGEVADLHPDFLIRAKFWADRTNEEESWVHSTVAVECDGHEYHERTKEQARRDKSRDRKLLSLGFPVLRFTGSEIHEGPLRAAESVLRIARHTGWQREYAERFRNEAAFRVDESEGWRAKRVHANSGLTIQEWAKRLGFEPKGDQ